MELNNYNLEEDAERGAELVLLDPRTGEELDVVINLKGVDSPTHEQLLRSEQTRKLAEGDDYVFGDGVIRVMTGLITGWSNITKDDKEYPYNYENSIGLLSDKKWVYDQIDNFVSTRTNFFLS